MARRKSTVIQPQVEYKSSIGWLWVLLALMATCAAAAHTFTMISDSWRYAEPIDYSYKYRNQRLNHLVGEVKYGLFRISYDSHSLLQTWDARVQLAKLKASAAAQIGQQNAGGSLFIWASMCPPACQEAVIFRASLYDSIRTSNVVLLACLAVAAAIAACGVAWMVIAGKHFIVQLCTWAIAAGLSGAAGGYWIYSTDQSWKQISVTQQVPYPSVSLCWQVYLVGVGLYLFAAIGVYGAQTLDNMLEKRQRNATVNQRLLEGQYSGYSAQFPGLFGMASDPRLSFASAGSQWGAMPGYQGLPFPSGVSNASQGRFSGMQSGMPPGMPGMPPGMPGMPPGMPGMPPGMPGMPPGMPGMPGMPPGMPGMSFGAGAAATPRMSVGSASGLPPLPFGVPPTMPRNMASNLPPVPGGAGGAQSRMPQQAMQWH